MEPTKRIVTNTLAQYVKAAINICLSLYATRLILQVLSISDYGIFTVVGGVIALLGFMTNALSITTQRYISYHSGQNDRSRLRKIFANSLFLHLLVGGFTAIILLVLRSWLVEDMLVIPPDRIDAANIVYVITVIMLLLTIITAPYKALFIARENIVYIAVVEIIDGILKFILALCIAYIPFDKLIIYTLLLGLILVLNLFAFVIYAKLHFEETCIIIRRADIDKSTLKQLSGFMGWSTYGMGAVAVRIQGTQMVMNLFYGTVINAAFGIAMQVYGALVFISTSILNAMNPQITKAEGVHNRDKAISLACKESKYSVSMMAIVSIPLMIEMPSVMSLWLQEVPDHAVMFCRFILTIFLCDQLTAGLNTLCEAMGNIRNYCLLVYTPKLLSLPIFYFVLRGGNGVETVMWIFLVVELFIALVRIPWVSRATGMKTSLYVKQVFLPLTPLILGVLAIGFLVTSITDMPTRFILNIAVCVIAGAVLLYLTASHTEQAFLRELISHKIKRHA